jgi:glycosyltransferase involved in cell wall biosynthesis
VESSIIHITKTLFGGGGEYALRLSQALVNAGQDSRVISLDGGLAPIRTEGTGRISAVYDRMFTSVINRRSSAPFSSFLRVSRFKPSQKISEGDIVHLHSITGFIGSRGLSSLIPKGAKVFWTAHNPWTFTAGCVLYLGCNRYQSGCNACPILRFPVKSLSKLEYRIKADFIRNYNVQPIANSEWMASMLRKSPWFSHVRDIPVIKPIVQPCFHSRGKRRMDLNISSDDKVVIGLGARSLTDHYKGIKEFFANLPADAPWIKKVRFLLFGEGSLSLPPNLDVQMMGALRSPEAMADAYRSMDLYVSPTSMETFGMTLVESQACGTPVIAFETGGTPEAVCPDVGILVPLGDFLKIYSAIDLCVNDIPELKSRGDRAASWVDESHRSDIIASMQLEAYRLK